MLLLPFVVRMLSIGVIVLGADVVSAQVYPTKPIRIVTSVAGGGNDFDARLIAQEITGPLGQPVIIENRGGAIAAEVVSKAPPDGYTLFSGGSGNFIRPLLEKMPWDMERDFTPISQIVRTVLIMAVHPSVPAKSVKELIALAKARPGELNYATASVGGLGHIGAELFKSTARVNIVHVPYKGNTQALTALISGEVQVIVTDGGLVTQHVKTGKLRALAVSSATPSTLAPGLPTVAATIPGYELVGVSGIFAPAKTPTAVINRLNQEIVRAGNRSEVKQRFFEMGEEVVGSSPEEFAAFIRSEITKMGKVIKDAGIKVY